MIESLIDLNAVWNALLAPAHYVLEPGRRLFWVFLLSALMLASLVVTWQQRRFDLKGQIKALCNRHYWWQRSTAEDVGWLTANSLIRGLLLVPLLGSHLAATIVVGSALQTTFGDAPELNWSLFWIGAGYTLVFFIAEDFSRFALHRWMHVSPFLWRFHTVHHSATNLTPVTVHRVHPVEMSLYYLRGLMVFGLVSGVFLYLFGGQLHGWEILGVDCLGFLFNALGANLRHTPIWLTFGRFERWFISPAQHQIHHSAAVAHYDKNFGTCLAIWDRLGNSWLPAKGQSVREYGLSLSTHPSR